LNGIERRRRECDQASHYELQVAVCEDCKAIVMNNKMMRAVADERGLKRTSLLTARRPGTSTEIIKKDQIPGNNIEGRSEAARIRREQTRGLI